MSDKAIPVAIPLLGEAEAQAARRAILSGWVTQGPEVAAFEAEFAAYVGAPFAKAVSSCTTALHMALLAVGVGPGDEVVTVSHSFVATANAVRYCGAMPVFVDILPGVWNMDPAQIQKAISPRTKAILCVHQLGMPCDLKAILAIAKPLGLPVIEDAACAIGSQINMGNGWERIGKPHGDIACFSFHPRKVITTGDGGMLTTANSDYDRRFALLRQHGMSVSDMERHNSNTVVFESYPELGYNYRLTDIQAAMGREQLKRLPDIIVRRRELAARYLEKLTAIKGLKLPIEPSWARSNWQSFCIGLPDGAEQRAVLQALLSAGISAKRGVMCAHREQEKGHCWSCAQDHCQCPPLTCDLLRESETAQDRCIIIPLFPQMENSDQDRVVEVLSNILTRS
jgi:dTDP-4-amino-4,6-dideoxygalactose transaminase